MAARSIGALIVALILGVLVSPAALAETPTPELEVGSWRFVDVEVAPDKTTVGQIATVRFSIEDGDGNLVPGLRATGMLRAPSTAYDASPPAPILTTIGREVGDPGRYEIAVALNHEGRWWIEIRVEDQFGNSARYDHFTIVDPLEDPAPATTNDPLFLRGDQWDRFFRVDPETGAVATLDGDELFKVADRWWVAETVLERRGVISHEYGGTWRLRFDLRDAISGTDITSIEIGDIRANVFSGSERNPAISTAITIAPDGSAVYVYWARQLGEGWLGHLAVADPATGEILEQRVLNGAISSNGFWADLFLLDDGQVVVAEQVVELASVSGYRLTLADADTLDPRAQYRRTDARDDPLTHCILTYPGPVGRVGGEHGNRFSLCSPPQSEHDLALVVWSPHTAQPVHTVDLAGVSASDSHFVDGIASPDGTTFYAVNTRTMHITEIDMITGDVMRERALLPEEKEDPSTLDRFFDWVFGAWNNPAIAAGTVEPSVTISHEGDKLYVVSRPELHEPAVVVVDLVELEISNSLLTGQVVDGLVATAGGGIAVIERGNGSEGDTVTIMDSEGSPQLSFVLPGRSDVLGSRR